MNDPRSVPGGGLTDDEFARLDALLDAEGVRAPGSLPIARRAATDAPLSPAQRRLWFLNALEGDAAAYSIAGAVLLHGPLDVDALERALTAVGQRHEALRLTFGSQDGEPRQFVHPARSLALERLEGGAASPAPDIARVAARLARTPWNLGRGPLVRAALVAYGPHEHGLALALHHIIADGWSLGVVLREIALLYALASASAAELSSTLPELPVQFTDVAAWQLERLRSGELDPHIEFWRQALRGAPAQLTLPTDRLRPIQSARRGAVVRFAVEPPVAAALTRVARAAGATPFAAHLACFQALLARWSGQIDVMVGIPAANREQHETAGLVGLLVNTLPVRGDLSGNPTLFQLLERARDAVRGALAHAEAPFERIVEAVAAPRLSGITPLFQALFAYQDEPASTLELAGLAVEPVDVDDGTAKFDLTLALERRGDGFVGALEFDVELFERATAERMIGHLLRIVQALAEGGTARLSDGGMLSSAETASLLAQLETPTALAAPGATIHALVGAQAARTPDAVAVIAGAEQLTYAELEARADRLARVLRDAGARPEVAVGLCLDRGPGLIVAMLAVLKAGAAWLPLDPAYPAQRLRFMLEDSGCPLIVTTTSLVGALPPGSARRILLDPLERAPEPAPGTMPAVEGLATGANLSHIIYTSGSTGRPKGVAIQHANVTALLAWGAQVFSRDQLAGVLASTSIGFDLSVFEIFLPLSVGGTVILAENALHLRTLAAADQVTLVNTVPSVLAELLRAGSLPRAVTTVCLAGEPLPATLAQRVHEEPGVRALFNLYGPTEDTTYSTCEQVAAGDPAPPSIGRPIAGTRAYLLDAGLHPVPVGVPGELYLEGCGLARGYLARPDLTAERFLPCPFSDRAGARMYRTGDRARLRADGRIEFLGRVDHQVKVRGFRIELGEIEAALRAHPAVRDAVVLARAVASGEQSLLAYVVPRDGAVAPAELRRHLGGTLPAHMVPSAFVTLAALPLTANGKLDRGALAARPSEPAVAAVEDAAPFIDAVEEILAGVWAEVLELPRVGVDQDFFALGGHSLSAVRVVARLERALGVALPLRALFEAPTVRALAGRVRALRGSDAPPIVRVPHAQRQQPSHAQQRLWFLDRLEPLSAAYNMANAVRIEGPLDAVALERALAKVVERHEALRTTFHEGPDGPLAVCAPSAQFQWAIEEFHSDLGDERDRLAAARAAAEARTPFDLAHGPLVRASLMRFAPDDHVLILVLHHIVSDGWSMGVLVRELAAAYGAFRAGGSPDLPPLPVQYADWAAWQRSWLDTGERARQLAYWSAELSDLPPLDLPTDRPRPARASQAGASFAVQLDAQLVLGLQRLARREGATLHMALLSAFAAVLGRWSGQRDFGIGIPVANRSQTATEGLIGLFVNSLVVRARLEGARLPFRTLLGRIRETALGAYAHQEIPFDRVVEQVQPARDLSRTPLFQVMLVLQNAPAAAPALQGARLTPLEAPTGTSTFDLTLSLGAAGASGADDTGLEGYVEYSTELFDPATVQRLWEHVRRMLQAAVGDPNVDVLRAPLLDPSERTRAVQTWSGRAAVALGSATFPELFARCAAAHPERIAAVLGPRRVTYGELDDRSARLAARLVELGVGPEVRVGVCAERSPEMLVAILAVHRAGGAFVPLDPQHPPARLAAALEGVGAGVVLAARAVAAEVAGPARSVVLIDDEATYTAPALAHPVHPAPQELAYVIFTSGTTGRPKGVMVSHGALAAAYEAWDRLYGLAALPVQLQMAGIAFDVCIGDVVRALGSGATLVFCERERLLDPPRLFELARQERVAFGDFLPAVARPLAAHARAIGQRLDDFRTAVVGADVWTSSEIPAFRALFGPHTRLGNSYGVTEATIDSTCGFIEGDRLPLASPPIGQPMSHTTAYVLDADFEPVPPGVAGELLLGGPAVGRGYHGQPDLTAERFVPDPFGEPGARMYRTGDRARWLPDGRIVFAGRVDDQVKIRGQRLEPAEVEAQVAALPGVAACAVAARRDRDGTARLAAWIVPEQRDRFDVEGARAQLRARLPEAMVPAAIVVLDALPLTANGKVDRRRLPEPEWTHAAAYEPPRAGTETAVAAAFAEVLQLECVGAEDDFFALGGHSLLATQVVSRLRARLGAEVPVRTLFEAPTVRGLAERVQGTTAPLVPLLVQRADDAERARLSYAQQRLWFLDRLEPSSAAYNLPSSILLQGALDAQALHRALSEVVRRHEALRTCFEEGEDGPRQRIAPPAPLRWTVEDLSSMPEPDRLAQADRFSRDEARLPFDLERGPLLRARLLRLAPERHRLLLTLHHIAADGWSLGVLLRELGALYGAFTAGAPSPLPELAVQYGDWAAWQRAWLEGGELDRQLSFWRSELADVQPLVLPADRPRAARPTWAGGALPLRISGTLREQLAQLARAEGATLHMVLLAAYAAAVGRWAGRDDFVVGSPVANRRTAASEPLIGFFVNTLPVRVRMAGDGLTFRGLLGRIRAACLAAYSHQDVPFERVVEELQPNRTLGHNPIVQTLFALQNAPLGTVALPGLTLDYEEPQTGVTRFDLEMFLAETPEGLEGVVHYSSELFERDTVARFTENFEALLERAVHDPDAALADVAEIAPAQRQRVLATWNAPHTVWPDPPLVHTLFEREAALRPNAVAAHFAGSTVTYGQLNARANALARRLREDGVGAEQLVAVCIERSFDMLVALLGVMKAGAAYVPVDPTYPQERIALIVADAGARVVVTQPALVERLPAHSARVLLLDAADAAAREGRVDLRLPQSPDSLVYAVYTSGSTGRPKGVAMTHRAISNLLSWQRRDSAPAARDANGWERAPRTLQFASLSFDVSFQEIFSTLTAGGELVLVSEDERRDTPRLLRLLDAQRVERIFVPFVALDQLATVAAAEGIVPTALREVATAGEQLRITPAIAAFFARLPGCRLVNHYGPSETHLVTTHEMAGDPARWAELPAIGRPIPNAPVVLLDRRGRLVPIGTPGEVHVGGAGLARGYHARADLTAATFVPDPFGTEPGGRLYRTGDVARFRGDGLLEFLGRRDLQVKVRGHRVEPGEVEAVLTRHPHVLQAVVMPRDHRGGKRLAAWVVLDDPARVTVAQLREHLKRTLPEYMVPSALTVVDALPLSPNGKVDRGGLPEPDWGASGAGVAPRTPQEELVCGIFAEVLALERVGVLDDFFELGGHSLLATQVMSRVRRAFDAELPLRVLFETPTPAGIAAAVAAVRPDGPVAPPPIRRADPAARQLLSYAQRRMWFLDRMVPGSAAYILPAVVRLEGLLDVPALERALGRIVQRHEPLRTRYVDGPQGPVQVIDPPGELRLQVETLAAGGQRGANGQHAQDIERIARDAIADEVLRPFDLAAGPVVRVRLLRLGPTTHLLSLVMHHIAADGWSMGILVRELGALYGAFVRGEADPLPESSLQYADWAAWQREWLEGGELQRQLAWWRAALAGAPARLELPTDRPRPTTATASGATLAVHLSEHVRARLAQLARSHGATLHMALLAAYAWTLMRSAGQREIVVGTPVANRRAAEAEALVGFFVNTLAVLVRAEGAGLSFRQLLEQVREASLGAYAHQDVPFERIVEEVQPERALDRSPVFQTAFALQNARLPTITLPGLTLQPYDVEGDSAKFDVMLTLEEATDGGLAGAFEYNTDLFERSTIEELAARMTALLERAVEAPEAALAPLDALRAQDLQQLATESGVARPHLDTGPRAPALLLHEQFERQAMLTPHAAAVVCGGRQLSYGQLDARANQLAHHLRALRVAPEQRVALLLERSERAIVALLAVLKAGAAYVPLEPGDPLSRRQRLLADADPKVVIVEGELEDAPTELTVVRLDLDAETIAGRPTDRPAARIEPSNLAYVIYTSGSTGRPKGVAVEHRQIVRYVDAVIDRLEIEPGWRVGLASTLAADLGHTSLFPALATGGCVHLLAAAHAFDAAAAEAEFGERGIDMLKIVPSHLQALLGGAHPERVMPQKLLVLGGEATPGARLPQLQALAPACRIANHYGPTEATVGAVAGVATPQDADRRTLPLGRPLAHARAYVLDGGMLPVPRGGVGELFLGGAGVARGYLGRPDATAERFVPDPFAPDAGARMYRTGDRVRWLRDGRLEFLGRVDDQVKVRGFRVEPGEVAAVLAEHLQVREAAVMAREDAAGSARLIAYVVPHLAAAPVVHGLARRQLPGGPAVAELNRNETDYLYREIFGLRAYVRHGITLRDGDTVFDVGANIGLFSVFTCLACRPGRVFAFEPNPHLQPILQANALAHGTAVTVLDVGLAERERSAEFTFFPGFSLLSGLHADARTEQGVVRAFLENQARGGDAEAAELAQASEGLLAERFAGRALTVRLRCLSDVVAEHGIERIHLLKVNVEKAELDVLRGVHARDWARIDQAVVEVDIAENRQPILDLFAAHGFETLVDQDPLLQRTELCYVYAARRGSGRALVPGAEPSVPALSIAPPLLTVEALRAHAARTLPPALQPAGWALLEALPLTPNGKLDRARLPEPAAPASEFVAPRGDLEQSIARIWAEVLEVPRVGAHDNFFDVGGHSLLLARVHARLRAELGAAITIVEMFRHPTVASLAARLAGHDTSPSTPEAGRERGARRRDAARARARVRRGAAGGNEA